MSKTLREKISQDSFLLLAHYATFAYQDILFDYLTKRKAKLVTKINFPLPELPILKNIEITNARPEEKETKIIVKSFSSPPFFAYIFQSLQLIYLIIRSSQVYDIVIAEDSLLAILSIFLKKLGKIKTVIFYSHGFDKKRFNNNLLMNLLYKKLEYFSATGSDYNWFLNRLFKEVRKKQGINAEKLFWIPSSIEIKTIKRKTDIFNHKIVFLGVVNKKNGAHLIPRIIQEVKKEIPNIQIDIIGSGDLSDWMKKEIRKLNLESNIKMLGTLEFNEFSPILTSYSLGIAPYEDVFDTLTATSDSMKMRIYLAAGLPVIITKGFIFSDEIERHKLGYAVSFRSKSFSKAIIALLKKKYTNLEIRKKALAYSEEYDIINIYNRVFEKVINYYL